MQTRELMFILYVRDQQRSAAFYEAVLGSVPRLHVPGMTEFQLADRTVLGLMPQAGIKTLLGAAIEDPALAAGVPRAELYLVVEDPAACHARVLAHGGRELDGLKLRDWGDRVAYSADPDGHVVAFASR